MDRYHKLLLGVVVAGLLLAGFAASGWIAAREDRIRGEERTKAAEETRAEIQKQQDVLAATVKQLEAEHERRLAALDQRFAQASSPQQVAQLAAQLMQLKQPIQFVTPSATPENPHPQPIAQVAAEDTPQVKAYLQQCENCKLNLETATKRLSYAEQQQELARQDLTQVTKERDQWRKAAKGGSVWTRMKRNAKWFFIGAGAGAIAATAAHR